MNIMRILILLSALAPAMTSSWAQSAPALSTRQVELREVELSYPAEAMVEAVRQATVAAQVQGRIIAAYVDAGSKVKSGQVLMRIDAREATEVLAGAQAQLAVARANFERTRSLFAQKFISQAALDKAEAEFKAASANAGQAGTVSSFSTITAPISGVVAQRLAEPGEMATPGRPLITVFDPQSLRVIASIPQYKLAEVKQTPRAKIEFPETGKWIDAVRVEILPTADIHTHAVSARAYLPDNLEGVIPGMFVRVHFITGKAKKLLLPSSAVLRRGEVTGVYVIDAGTPHLRQVRLGEAVVGGDLEVLAGIVAGESVALDPVKASIALKQINK